MKISPPKVLEERLHDYWDHEAEECDHDWLTRPESDTHQCLICGDER